MKWVEDFSLMLAATNFSLHSWSTVSSSIPATARTGRPVYLFWNSAGTSVLVTSLYQSRLTFRLSCQSISITMNPFCLLLHNQLLRKNHPASCQERRLSWREIWKYSDVTRKPAEHQYRLGSNPKHRFYLRRSYQEMPYNPRLLLRQLQRIWISGVYENGVAGQNNHVRDILFII